MTALCVQVRFPSHLSPRALVAFPREDCERGGYHHKVYVFFYFFFAHLLARRNTLSSSSSSLTKRHLMQVPVCVLRWRRRPISAKRPGTYHLFARFAVSYLLTHRNSFPRSFITREYRDVSSSKGMPTSTVYPTRSETPVPSHTQHSTNRLS